MRLLTMAPSCRSTPCPWYMRRREAQWGCCSSCGQGKSMGRHMCAAQQCLSNASCVWLCNASSAHASKQSLSPHVSTCFEARPRHHMLASKEVRRQHMLPSTKGRNTKRSNAWKTVRQPLRLPHASMRLADAATEKQSV